jgi:hypothetical protein
VTYNFVVVSINLTDPTGQALSEQNAFRAGLTFQVSDIVYDIAAGTIVAVPPITVDTLQYTQPNITVTLLADDTQSLSDNWGWLVAPSVHGGSYPVRKLSVAYANGATQNLATLLVASTLVT